MPYTVKELIAELEKFPPDEEVHAYLEFETDQGGGASPGSIHYVGRASWSGKLIIGVADEYTMEHCD